jgi:hypothetical protein
LEAVAYRLEQNHALALVEHEDRRPAMMVDGFFVVWLQSYFKHAKPFVLEEGFVVLWRSDYGVQCRIPSKCIYIRTIICHDYLAG